jgi:hypothetical protein
MWTVPTTDAEKYEQNVQFASHGAIKRVQAEITGKHLYAGLRLVWKVE